MCDIYDLKTRTAERISRIPRSFPINPCSNKRNPRKPHTTTSVARPAVNTARHTVKGEHYQRIKFMQVGTGVAYIYIYESSLREEINKYSLFTRLLVKPRPIVAHAFTGHRRLPRKGGSPLYLGQC